MKIKYNIYVKMRIKTYNDTPSEFEYNTCYVPWLDVPNKSISIATGTPKEGNYNLHHYETAGIHEVIIVNVNTNEMQVLTLNPAIITPKEIKVLEQEYKNEL